jgi:hypothetical protein
MPCLSIDSLALDTCALIKIDAEGLEADILKGSAGTLAALGPAVYAECNCVEDGASTLSVLKAAGYSAYLHLADTFNGENTRGVKDNIFGSAREAAFIALPAEQESRLRLFPRRPCELLMKIETLDDLVLGLLNKPQYPGEVLEQGQCAKTGGVAWLQAFHEAHLAEIRLRDLLDRTERVPVVTDKAEDRKVHT